MHGFKMSLDLAMPMERPDSAPLCDECSMKHAQHDGCWEGMLPAGMLPLPTFDKNMTGRELIDEGMPENKELSPEKVKIGKSLMDKLKSKMIPMAKNVKVIKKEKKRGAKNIPMG